MSSTFIPPGPPSFTVPVPYGPGAEDTAAARGSYGQVIGMLAVLVVLAAAAVAVGRLCFGRRAGGGGHDLEAWVERTCGPCVGVTRPTAKEEGGSGAVTAVSVPAATTEQPPEGTSGGS